ncbi:MAG: [FeFe] hydrogenase H-cluster radical SAM maturase HydE [Synergistetes bacterium]|nr:[FeFe] hydrogenase H-cluster radical SAM maturase HydE [Synergistota bacterium]
MTKDEILYYLKTHHEVDMYGIFELADRVRKRYCGDGVHLRGIIEFSNCCVRNCLYCGLRRGNGRARRYRMTVDEVYQVAECAVDAGVKTIVLQSGEDPYYSVSELCRMVERVKELDVAVTLSLGEKSYRDYRSLKEAGADRYLLKFETSDKRLYALLKPDSSYVNRFRCLEYLSELGYQVGSGNMVGLPNQSSESIADDILLFGMLELDMVGIGPFIPHPDTPLGGFNGGSSGLTVKVIALTRILTRNAHIPATTALATVDPEGRRKALCCGANVVMPNVTPFSYAADYEIYPDKLTEDTIDGAKKLVSSVGRYVAKGYGHSLKMGGNVNIPTH